MLRACSETESHTVCGTQSLLPLLGLWWGDPLSSSPGQRGADRRALYLESKH